MALGSLSLALCITVGLGVVACHQVPQDAAAILLEHGLPIEIMGSDCLDGFEVADFQINEWAAAKNL